MFSRFTPLNLVILLISNPLINQRLRRGWKNDHDLLDPPSFSFRLANRYEAVQLRFGFTVRISSKVSSQTSFPVTSSVVSPLHGEPRYLLNTVTNVDDRTELVSVWYFFWRKKGGQRLDRFDDNGGDLGAAFKVGQRRKNARSKRMMEFCERESFFEDKYRDRNMSRQLFVFPRNERKGKFK